MLAVYSKQNEYTALKFMIKIIFSIKYLIFQCSCKKQWSPVLPTIVTLHKVSLVNEQQSLVLSFDLSSPRQHILGRTEGKH